MSQNVKRLNNYYLNGVLMFNIPTCLFWPPFDQFLFQKTTKFWWPTRYFVIA